MDDNTPATKADIESLRSEMKTMERRLTGVLRAFYNYMQPNDLRMASTDNEAASVRIRLAALEARVFESRLSEVEMKLNMPPAA